MYQFPLSCGIDNSKVNFTYQALYQSGKQHSGIDLDATDAYIGVHGVPLIVATIAGIVYRVGFDAKGWGNYLVVLGADGYYHIYAHMAAKPPWENGQTIQQGDIIGTIGTTGNSTGIHLHYEVRKSYQRKVYINPCLLLGIQNKVGPTKTTQYTPEPQQQEMTIQDITYPITVVYIQGVPYVAYDTVERIVNGRA